MKKYVNYEQSIEVIKNNSNVLIFWRVDGCENCAWMNQIIEDFKEIYPEIEFELKMIDLFHHINNSDHRYYTPVLAPALSIFKDQKRIYDFSKMDFPQNIHFVLKNVFEGNCKNPNQVDYLLNRYKESNKPPGSEER